MEVDFSNVPCFLCKPKTLGECGHPVSFMDDDYMAEQSKAAMEQFGRDVAQREMAHILSVLADDTVLTRFPPFTELTRCEVGGYALAGFSSHSRQQR